MRKQNAELIAAVQKNGKWGFIDENGELAIACTLYAAKGFENGKARVKKEATGPWYYVDKNGIFHQEKPVPCPPGKIVGPFKDGIAKVGSYVTKVYTSSETVYDNVADFDGHTEYTSTSCTWVEHAYMNEDGKLLTGYDYQSHDLEWRWDEISDGLIRVVDARTMRCGYMDKTGRLVIPCKWDSFSGTFHEGMANTCKYVLGAFPKEGFINKKGEMVIKKRWEQAGDFHEGMAWIKLKSLHDLYSYINKQGVTVISAHFWKYCGDFHEGLAVVRQDGEYGLWGYIDKSGKYAIPCHWEGAGDFHEGLAAVKENGLWGYIDKKGNLVSPCQWDAYGEFCNGVAVVKKGDLLGCLDRAGNLITPCKWDDIRR